MTIYVHVLFFVEWFSNFLRFSCILIQRILDTPPYQTLLILLQARHLHLLEVLTRL